MVRLFRALALVGLLAAAFGAAWRASAHDPHVCPEGFPDTPAVAGHVEHEQIVNGALPFEPTLEIGQAWFEAVVNDCDGQGGLTITGTSAPAASSCAGCHNRPRSGGGGDFTATSFVLAQRLDLMTDPVSGELSDGRNTVGVFGAGPIEMLAREMTAELQAIRATAVSRAAAEGVPVTIALMAKGIGFGAITALPDGVLDTRAVEGVNPDLIVRPFYQAGVVVSLRESTVNELNHHHVLQAEEAFDLDPFKGPDFDQDGITRELTTGDVTAIVLWQAALGVPGRVLPAGEAGRQEVSLGEQFFLQVGCAGCHAPELQLNSRFFSEPNPWNPPSAFRNTSQLVSFDMTTQGEGPTLELLGQGAVIRAYTDLKRHDPCDDPGRPDAIRHFCNEELAQNRLDQGGRPGAEYFLTRKLWDVGNSAPYGHRGDLATIAEAILAHGGEARISRDAFMALPAEQQAAIVRFLKTLQVLPPGSPRVITEGQTGSLPADEPAAPRPAGGEASLGDTLVSVLAALVVIALAGLAVLLLWPARRRGGSTR
ncbi:MAG: hypothetical protein L0332_14380 [Chloroflexi bacterium]|nr:hypothetical protein [Chloroflexota bacterium]MCI0581213.1 hypothetical protein [Chloroflexota bacterium]MCI0644072.1 hypothetical protein [Chloroflexota bacterium]MCI0727888.1 hypothetical protein [Chloroflexota bacterium]